jgi:O-antigen ligase
MEPLPASTTSLERLQRLALVASLPVGAGLGYFIAARGARGTAAVLGFVGLVGLLIVGLNRLHLTLLPLAVMLPLGGYLIVLRPEAGFSLVFDVLALLPFAALTARWLVRPYDLDLFSGPQLLVWGFLFVALFQFVNPDGTPLTVSIYGFRRMVVPMLLFFVAFHLNTTAPGSLRRLGWCLMLTGWIPAVWGLKQYLLGLTPAEHQYAKQIASGWVGQEVRIFSTFQGPWALATYLAGIALLALSLAAAARSFWPRLAAVAVAVLATITLSLTYIRGCLVGYLVGVTFLVILFVGSRIGMRRVAVIFLALLVGYIAFALFVGPAILEYVSVDSPVARRVLTILAPTKEFAFEARLLTWSTIQDILLRYPLGIGLGSTAGVSARFQSQLRLGPVHPDNSYLGAALETGWLGGILFIAIVVRLVIMGIRLAAQRSAAGDGWVLRGAAAYLITVAIASLAAPVSFESGAGALYWLVSGIVARQGTLATGPVWSIPAASGLDDRR